MIRTSALTLALLACAFTGCEKKTVEKTDSRPLVRVGAVTNGVLFTDSLKGQGMVRAKYTASIAARVPGSLDALLVEEGASVKKGQILFQVDRINLGNAVRAAKDDLLLAKAKLTQAEAMASKAKLDAERMARLLKDAAVTKDMCEKAEVGAKSHAAALDAAKATLTKAQTGLCVAEKNYADSEVRAPFDGVITKKHKNAGDFCGAGMRVFEIEDTSTYEVCLSLNATQYARVTVGKTLLSLKDGRKLPLTYKAPAVNPLTRTFEVRAALAKTPSLAAGMLVDAEVVFDEHKGPAVPTSAVALRGGTECLFKVVNGKVVRVEVEAGLTRGGWREIIKPAFTPDDPIILEGMLLVNEGDEVRTIR